MACNEQDPNCQPCKDCPPTPDPILPRCDVSLINGTFTNSTVVVEDGCIISVATGRAPQYTPNICCDEVGGGGGGGNDEPCDCPPGDDGENATIEIGTVQSVAAGQPARVFNDGTLTNAVLRFEIPRGADGNNANQPSGANSSAGGIEIVNGLVASLPAAWPPALFINASSSSPGMNLTASPPDAATGVVSLVLEMGSYDNNLRAWVNQQIANATTPLQLQITALQGSLSSLQSQVAAMQATLTTCCP